MSELKNKIVAAVKKAQGEKTLKVALLDNPSIKVEDFKNEMVLFIKPEITKPGQAADLDAIVTMILEKMAAFKVEIRLCELLGAQHLKDNAIMAAHYGAINKIASNAKTGLSEAAKTKFKESFGMTIDEAGAMGGIEFLAKNPEMNPTSLDYLWQNSQMSKLAGGTYCGVVKIDGKSVYLMNGFHARQLEQFIGEGRSIVAFHVVSNTDWNVLRNDLIGATNPAKANEGSIRKTLLDNQAKFGLEEVSQGLNGVHLSAGPVEGLTELCRFFRPAPAVAETLKGFNMGRALIAAYGEDKATKLLSNPNMELGGNKTNVFDATEEKNPEDALKILGDATIAF